MADARSLVPESILNQRIVENEETAKVENQCSSQLAYTQILIKPIFPKLVHGKIIEKEIRRSTWAVIHPPKLSRESIDDWHRFLEKQMFEVESVLLKPPVVVHMKDPRPVSYIKGIKKVMEKYHTKLEVIVLALGGNKENRISACKHAKDVGTRRYGLSVVGFAWEDFQELHRDKDTAWRMINKILNRQGGSLTDEKDKILPKPEAQSKEMLQFELLETPETGSSRKQEPAHKTDESQTALTPLRRPPYRSIPYEGFADHKKVFQKFSPSKCEPGS